MTSNLKILTHRRGAVKAKLTRFDTFLDSIDLQQPDAINELETRLNAFSAILSQFETIQSAIESEIIKDEESTEDQLTAQDEERAQFENRYFSLTTRARSLLDSFKVAQDAEIRSEIRTSSERPTNAQQLNVSLPQLNLPEFSGNYETWTQFRDTFEALINNNAALSNIQKFYYLLSALKGDASQLIQAIQITDANYNTAWSMLIERFENKKAIIQGHLKGIVELPNISKESYPQLRKFLDTYNRHSQSLKNLGERVDDWNTLLLFLLTSKLDVSTKRAWEDHIKNDKSPTIDKFKKFLQEKCHFLESLESKVDLSNSQPQFKRLAPNKTLTHIATDQGVTCPTCKESHYIYNCKKFLDMQPSTRYTEVKRLNLCTNCLRPGHANKDCKSRSCKKCSKRHNSLLHSPQDFATSPTDNNTNMSSISQSISPQSPEVVESKTSCVTKTNASNDQITQTHCGLNAHCNNHVGRSSVFLSTVVVNIHDKTGKTLKCRCLLDNGSQSNFITENLFRKLNLDTTEINLPVSGINQFTTKITNLTQADISSTDNNYRTRLTFLIIKNITDLIPQRTIDVSQLNIPNNIELADPHFNQSSPVDMLLGAGIFFELLSVGYINLGHGKPSLQNTKFGWIIGGELVSNNCQARSNCFLTINTDLQNQLEQFWNIEESSQTQAHYSKEEQECEIHFVNTFKRDESNRFCLQLPFRDNHDQLGDSLETALQRLYSLENRLQKNPQLKSEYSNFLQEYESLGHMTQIKGENLIDKRSYYLPHHCVEKQTSTTTKLRVLFDASCKSTSGLSLNDVLKVGPTIQNDLFSILIRFRQHNIVLTGDINKMYRQINVDESQRDFQRIVWRTDKTESIKHYRLNTITYGTSSASFLATRCLAQLAIENRTTHPLESEIIMSDFYMDDLLTGAQDVESMVKIKTNIEQILESSGFQLRKFMSNDPQVLIQESHQDESVSHYVISSTQSSKTLGVSWNPSSDEFVYCTQLHVSPPFCKRTILSVIAQIFDPLGLLQPIIIKAKLFLQELWRLKIDWDDPISEHLHEHWVAFSSQLKHINSIKIHRQVTISNPAFIQIHGFCDSSEQAYGACIYILSKNSNNDVKIKLLCAKTRVAPLKVLSIPQLELCGALLLSKLMHKIVNTLRLNINDIFCWTDSTIVLSWISSEPSNWKSFVANRVSEIQQLTSNAQWLHVPTDQNPADMLSRGIDPSKLASQELWWYGPSFLTRDLEFWPKQPAYKNSNSDVEKRTPRNLIFTISFSQDIVERFSSFSRLQRVLAYCFRFIHNTRSQHTEKLTGHLSIKELNAVTLKIIQQIQSQYFSQDIRSLSRNESVQPSSKLASLNPFLDNEGIIRVGGRIKHSNVPYSTKHPIVLPNSSYFTTLIIRHVHVLNLHSGAQATLSFVRQNYWPLGGRNEVRRVLRACVTCFKSKPVHVDPKMGDLPSVRVIPDRVFASCGVDYAGPFPLKDGKTRNRKIIKSYLCIFVCLLTKALHLELVTDLTSEAFLNALKRFVSRRGLCKHIYSDNATNFQGASKELTKIFNDLANESKFNSFLTQSHIQWHFIPARSAHFGGLWEAAVKSVKTHLKGVTVNVNLTYEEFSTLLCQIEAVLNSRPLFPISNDPNDLEVLTPGHFIIGSALNLIPQWDTENSVIRLSSKFKHLQLMTEHFWNRWSRDYLHNMQQRTKWKFNKEPEKLEGALVLLREDNLPPSCWCLGRITAIHPGEDGIVRVVSVKVKNGIVKRAVSRVCVLPIEH